MRQAREHRSWQLLAWVGVACVSLIGNAWCPRVQADAASAVEIPAHNRADQREPPPRPEPAQTQALAATLFQAIVANDPQLAAATFFPRDAFVLVKGISHPERYFDRLRARFDTDIRALHASLLASGDPAHASFDHFELSQRGAFVRPGEEANRLPYWASRHSRLYYRQGSERQLKSIEVRVLISWDDRWYVIHLSELRSAH